MAKRKQKRDWSFLSGMSFLLAVGVASIFLSYGVQDTSLRTVLLLVGSGLSVASVLLTSYFALSQ